MCETNAYIEKDGAEELYLENVDIVIPNNQEGKIYIKDIFGEQKVFDGYIKEVSLSRHKIILKTVNSEQ